MNRRKVLKVSGASLAALSGVSSASAADAEAERFEGIAYNPRTDRETGEAFGNIVRVPNGKLRGTIQLPDYSIPLAASEPASVRKGVFTQDCYLLAVNARVKDNQQTKQIRTPAQVISCRGASVSGWIRNPLTNERDAFFLGYKAGGYTREDVREGLEAVNGGN